MFLLDLKGRIVAESVVDTGNRRLDCLIFRMRLGHIQLGEYLFKIGKAENDLCSHCEEVETLEHYLIECERYANDRLCLYTKVSKILGYPRYNLLVSVSSFYWGEGPFRSIKIGILLVLWDHISGTPRDFYSHQSYSNLGLSGSLLPWASFTRSQGFTSHHLLPSA